MTGSPTPATRPTLFAPRDARGWLFGPVQDSLAFGGSALAAVLLVAAGGAAGILDQDAPDWVWLSCILLVDVAHVWSTVFRVYLDTGELRRRPVLYAGVPVACYLAGVGLFELGGAGLFWRVLAYGAVFHFIRQQYGWVRLYGRRAQDGDLDRWLDAATIYAATLYPVLWWHAHLPRRFFWFVDGDFLPGLATPVADALMPLYWGLLAAFVARQAYLVSQGRFVSPGKVLVVLTTWLCWWLGIIALDSDFAFTVTNVLIHGVPYFVLTYRYGRARSDGETNLLALTLQGGVLSFFAIAVGLALVEETLWDRWVWHDRPWLFGESEGASAAWLPFVVPLLALPQATHYALDGVIWRRGSMPAR